MRVFLQATQDDAPNSGLPDTSGQVPGRLRFHPDREGPPALYLCTGLQKKLPELIQFCESRTFYEAARESTPAHICGQRVLCTRAPTVHQLATGTRVCGVTSNELLPSRERLSCNQCLWWRTNKLLPFRSDTQGCLGTEPTPLQVNLYGENIHETEIATMRQTRSAA